MARKRTGKGHFTLLRLFVLNCHMLCSRNTGEPEHGCCVSPLQDVSYGGHQGSHFKTSEL